MPYVDDLVMLQCLCNPILAIIVIGQLKLHACIQVPAASTRVEMVFRKNVAGKLLRRSLKMTFILLPNRSVCNLVTGLEYGSTGALLLCAKQRRLRKCIIRARKLPLWFRCEEAYCALVSVLHAWSWDDVKSCLLPTVVGKFSVDEGSLCPR